MNGLRVTGYVLAGGESRRMQQAGQEHLNKALLPWGGGTLLQHAVRTLERVCDETYVLCGTDERCARLRCGNSAVPDRLPGCGPLGALLSALEHAPVGWVVLLPVDMPRMPSSALSVMMDAAVGSGAGVVCWSTGADGFQPLPAVIATGMREAVAAALHAGERRLDHTLQEIAGKGLLLLEAAVYEPRGARDWWVNLNTPEDLRHDRAQAGNESAGNASD